MASTKSPGTATRAAAVRDVSPAPADATGERDQLLARIQQLETELAGERQASASPLAGVAAGSDTGNTPAPKSSSARRGRIVRYTGADPTTGEQVSGVGVVVDHDEETTTVVPLPGGYTVPHDNIDSL